jgi:hypothetical protein
MPIPHPGGEACQSPTLERRQPQLLPGSRPAPFFHLRRPTPFPHDAVTLAGCTARGPTRTYLSSGPAPPPPAETAGRSTNDRSYLKALTVNHQRRLDGSRPTRGEDHLKWQNLSASLHDPPVAGQREGRLLWIEIGPKRLLLLYLLVQGDVRLHGYTNDRHHGDFHRAVQPFVNSPSNLMGLPSTCAWSRSLPSG